MVKICHPWGHVAGFAFKGVYLAGYPVARYLEFPPQTRYIEHAPFSWPAFTVLTFIILAVVHPFAVQGIQGYKKRPQKFVDSTPNPFPGWGWLGISTGIVAWILAWTHFPWFIPYQPHTFSPLWFSLIMVVNALCVRRTGHSLMTDRPGFFLLLFPASAVFWWFFEYLNRFVQNWYYTGVEFSPRAYFWYATLPFTTIKERHIFSEMAAGDWRDAVSAALAALFCGWFWEMWNYFSLAKWEYSVPLVHRFLIFEMPLLGYGGYLPFGLVCIVIGGMLEKFNICKSSTRPDMRHKKT